MTTIKQLVQGRYKQNLFIKLDSTNGLHTGQARYPAHTHLTPHIGTCIYT